MPHPHGDCKGFFRVKGHNTIWNPHRLRAIELKDLVTVMAIVSGEAHSPVEGAAGGREEFRGAGSSP